MSKKWKQLIAICAIGGVSWMLVQSPSIDQYVTTLKSQSVSVVKKNDPLLEEIKQKAKEYEVSPKDAMIDSVWKTVPGYNGLKVDILSSYNVMKDAGVFDEKKLIYKQIRPKVHLSQLKAAPIYRAHPDKPVASFLINVAWGNEYIPQMLSVLKKHNVKATFFLEGRWTKNNPELAKMITGAGHEVGNHSYTHPNMQRLSSSLIRKEIQETNDVIKAVTGVSTSLFAPPSGAFRDETVTIADELGMDTIMWSVDTIDWQKPTPAVLTERVLSKMHNGAFILMHPTETSAKSLETLIVNIKKKQLHITTVSEALKEERIMH
ncbi:polysaccharide deacetylase family protein [Bacillus massiliigorillae]|uniref:polysaccharide deacetylase family protein n=1 Tax=Bacillus massiliigorillae TaxID=1243664 RepID=UPI0003A57050|nr:polysaccharide deacetylase family protein [Bacillus massiliigorillae]